MLIDVHADVGAWAFRKLWTEDVAGLLELMEASGIARAIVGPVEGILYRNAAEANARLFEALERAGRPSNILPAAALNPLFPGWERDLQEAKDAGAVAIKAYPNYHNYSPASRAAREMVEAVAAKGLPIIFCARVEDERQHHPLMLRPPVDATAVAQLARAVGGAQVILACGNQAETEAFLATAPPERSWADISFLKSPTFSVEHIVSRFGAARVLFGTHMPFLDPGATVIKLQMAQLAPEAREAIAWRNAASLWPQLQRGAQ